MKVKLETERTTITTYKQPHPSNIGVSLSKAAYVYIPTYVSMQ